MHQDRQTDSSITLTERVRNLHGGSVQNPDERNQRVTQQTESLREIRKAQHRLDVGSSRPDLQMQMSPRPPNPVCSVTDAHRRTLKFIGTGEGREPSQKTGRPYPSQNSLQSHGNADSMGW